MNRPLEDWAELVRERLPPDARGPLCARVLPEAARLRRRVSRLGHALTASRLVVTVGTILVPLLASLQGTASPALLQSIQWLVWSLGLVTSLSNASIGLFGLDRKYFLLRDQLSHLESEAWLFLVGAGRYRHHHDDHEFGKTSHFDGAGEGPKLEPRQILPELTGASVLDFVERCEAILAKAQRVGQATSSQEQKSVPAGARRAPTGNGLIGAMTDRGGGGSSSSISGSGDDGDQEVDGDDRREFREERQQQRRLPSE